MSVATAILNEQADAIEALFKARRTQIRHAIQAQVAKFVLERLLFELHLQENS
jgi:hypothetical protein